MVGNAYVTRISLYFLISLLYHSVYKLTVVRGCDVLCEVSMNLFGLEVFKGRSQVLSG